MGAKASITRIPTSVDLALFDPKNIDQNLKNELSAKLNLYEKFVLGYSGSLGTWYLLEEMLLFFKKLKEEKSNAHLLIISHDDNKLVFSKAFKLGIKKEDISILSATRNEMPLYLSLFDLSLMFIKASFSKKASSPTKLAKNQKKSVRIPNTAMPSAATD